MLLAFNPPESDTVNHDEMCHPTMLLLEENVGYLSMCSNAVNRFALKEVQVISRWIEQNSPIAPNGESPMIDPEFFRIMMSNFPEDFDLDEVSRKRINTFIIWFLMPAHKMSLSSLQFLSKCGRDLAERVDKIIAQRERSNP